MWSWICRDTGVLPRRSAPRSRGILMVIHFLDFLVGVNPQLDDSWIIHLKGLPRGIVSVLRGGRRQGPSSRPARSEGGKRRMMTAGFVVTPAAGGPRCRRAGVRRPATRVRA